MQTAFGIVFLIVRGSWWLWVTVPWWIEMVQLLSQERCHSQAAVLLYLATNLFLSYLQLKWCVQIVRAAMGLDAPDGGGELRTHIGDFKAVWRCLLFSLYFPLFFIIATPAR